MIIESELQEFKKGDVLYAFYDEEFNFAGQFLIQKENQFWNVLIFPEFRGKRLCEKMFAEFFEFAKLEKYVLVVDKTNISARKSYERMGFKYVENTIMGEFSELLGFLQMEIIKGENKNG